MEKLGTAKVVAFDKTGTLTVGQPTVTKIKTFDTDENELLRLAAIGESYSEHPLGKAIINKAQEKPGAIHEVPDDAEIITGQGLKFSFGGDLFYR